MLGVAMFSPPGRPPKFPDGGPNSPKTSSPLANGFAEHQKFRHKRFITADSPPEEVSLGRVCLLCVCSLLVYTFFLRLFIRVFARLFIRFV